jgi:hypothetical protein
VIDCCLLVRESLEEFDKALERFEIAGFRHADTLAGGAAWVKHVYNHQRTLSPYFSTPRPLVGRGWGWG